MPHALPAGLLRLFVVLDTNILLTRFWHAQKVLEVLEAAPRMLVAVVFVVPWVSQRCPLGVVPLVFLGSWSAAPRTLVEVGLLFCR